MIMEDIMGIIIGIAVILILGLILFGMVKGILSITNRFNFIQNIIEKGKTDKEKKKRKRIINIVVILIMFVGFILSFANAVIVFMHILAFVFIAEIIGKIVKRCCKKESNIYWQGVLGLLAVVVYLSIGVYNNYHVRNTYYNLRSEKKIGHKLKVVQISDSHLGTTFDGNGFKKYMEKVNKLNPDIVVVTGDYVDDGTKKKDMLISNKALGKINAKYGVYLIHGNHDRGYYNGRSFSIEEMDKDLEKNNVKVLRDESVLAGDIYVVGRKDKSEKDRLDISELIKDLDKSKYMMVLDHQPNDYDNEEKAGVDLVLSGHTHGGQIIPVGMTGELSGVNDMTYGLKKKNKTTFIVNSGISDWEIKFKTGTFSEIGVIEIEG